MTEIQFEKTLKLWKECEKHGLTTAQMYHISEILRSYVNPDPIIDDYLTAVMNGELPYTNGIPKKITLCSDGICYGPCPEPDEERIQKVRTENDYADIELAEKPGQRRLRNG